MFSLSAQCVCGAAELYDVTVAMLEKNKDFCSPLVVIEFWFELSVNTCKIGESKPKNSYKLCL